MKKKETVLSNELLLSIGGGVASAFLSLLSLKSIIFSVLLGLFIPFPLVMVGLRQGVKSCFVATAVGLVVFSGVAGFESGGLFFFMMGGPSVLLTHRVLLRIQRPGKKTKIWYPVGDLLSDLALYGLLILTAFFVFMQFYPEAMGVTAATLTAPTPETEQLIEMLRRIVPFMFALNPLIATVVSALLAQKFLEAKKLNLRPAPKIVKMALPWWPWGAFAFGGVLMVQDFSPALSDYGLNAVLLLSLLFILVGLTIVHAYSYGQKQIHPKLFLWIFYILMVVFGWPVLIIMTLGVFEPWLGLRKKILERRK